jgi:hypothetical protein
MKRRKGAGKKRHAKKLRGADEGGRVVDLVADIDSRTDTSPVLSGGDVDADWHRAADSGEEAVGGTVATPDQDVVDELGRALGVEQEPDAEVRTSEEILAERDRHRWRLERKAADTEDA